MREIELHFTFDYVDPGSYVASVLLHRWIGDAGKTVRVSWTPLELRKAPAPAMDFREPHWSEMTRAIGDHAQREGIPFVTPEHIPHTRKAHELAFHARDKGCFQPVHQALFEAHFETGRDIGRIDVLVAIGAEHGLDAGEARTVLGVDRFGASVDDARNSSIERGIRGVPTLVGPRGTLEGFASPASFSAFLGSLLQGEPKGAST